MSGVQITIRATTADLERFQRDAIATAEALERAYDDAAQEISRDGLQIAKRNARENSGAHGKHYPRAARRWRLGAGQYLYGPDPTMKQGAMSFEDGSRNQPPHNDYGNSADRITANAERVTVKHVDRALGAL